MLHGDDLEPTTTDAGDHETESDLSGVLQRLDFELDRVRQRLRRDLPESIEAPDNPRDQPGT